MLTANAIRQQFIDFFVEKHGHTFVPSSSVVPHDDPTLLFSNAGMNQFKDVFLGIGTRPYRRAANTQKCIRAGGKHNDLDDVGKDTYHHTFFEMLGNWSFGDYFKKEAIRWAWELLTVVWQLDKSRLHATVFEGDDSQGLARDDEAAALWRSETDINPTHVHWGNKQDNFWEMGDTGPCGPCSEIHYDRTPNKSGGKLVNGGTPDVIEIWNLVFIQFNRGADRKLTPLPAKHVDTGMGFERVTAVIQNKASNYDTDIFTPIFEAIQRVTGAVPYTGKLEDIKDTAYRVIADHMRALTFALTDGAEPSNEKRGYVLRSILRRAERYGRQYLGTKMPFLHELVPTVVEVMRGPFPELMTKPDQVAKVIFGEEQQFIRTWDRGIGLFNKSVEDAKKGGGPRPQITDAVAFQLHDTYGFFIDIVEQMAAELGMGVDRTGFDRLMAEAKEKARGAHKKIAVTAISGELPKTDDAPKYKGGRIEATILGWVEGNTVHRTGELPNGRQIALLLDKTNFYAEQGGQVGDRGAINTDTGTFHVEDTQRLGDTVLHVGKFSDLSDSLQPGQKAVLVVDRHRADTMRNHTTTHVLNWALRKVLGGHVEQKGSLVDPDKTRFDFTHDKPLSAAEIAEVERLVNEKLYADLPVTAHTLPLADAKKLPGVRAVFGEKYPDPVRVLVVGADRPQDATAEHSIEFCGGTHLTHTGQAGFFKLVGQELVGKGVRRVVGVTGREAVNTVQRLAAIVDDLTARFNCNPEQLGSRIESLQAEVKKLQTQLKKGQAGDLNGAADKLLADAAEVNGAKIIIGELPAASIDQMRAQVDRLRTKAKSAVICFGWVDEGKVLLLTGVTDDLTKKVEAGKLVGEMAKVVGGKGGGRKDMAQAGGSDPSKLGAALALAKKTALEKLG